MRESSKYDGRLQPGCRNQHIKKKRMLLSGLMRVRMRIQLG